MSNIVKTNQNTNVPGFAAAFPNLVPVHIPQRTYQTGIVSGIIRNIKIGQIEKESERMAKIAENQCVMVKANCEMVKAISSLSAEISATIAEADARREIARESINEARLKNQRLYYETERERIAFEMEKRNFEDNYGGSS